MSPRPRCPCRYLSCHCHCCALVWSLCCAAPLVPVLPLPLFRSLPVPELVHWQSAREAGVHRAAFGRRIEMPALRRTVLALFHRRKSRATTNCPVKSQLLAAARPKIRSPRDRRRAASPFTKSTRRAGRSERKTRQNASGRPPRHSPLCSVSLGREYGVLQTCCTPT